jgi:DNA-binding transcriptional ArsR family regulator
MSNIHLSSNNGVAGGGLRRPRSARTKPHGHTRAAPSADSMAPIRELCALMANRLRQRVLIVLAAEPMEVSQLAHHLQTGISGLSQNLKRLLKAGVVRVDQLGRTRLYRLGPGTTVKRRGTKVHLELTARDGSRLSIAINADRAPRPPRKA